MEGGGMGGWRPLIGLYIYMCVCVCLCVCVCVCVWESLFTIIMCFT